MTDNRTQSAPATLTLRLEQEPGAGDLTGDDDKAIQAGETTPPQPPT